MYQSRCLVSGFLEHAMHMLGWDWAGTGSRLGLRLQTDRSRASTGSRPNRVWRLGRAGPPQTIGPGQTWLEGLHTRSGRASDLPVAAVRTWRGNRVSCCWHLQHFMVALAVPAASGPPQASEHIPAKVTPSVHASSQCATACARAAGQGGPTARLSVMAHAP